MESPSTLAEAIRRRPGMYIGELDPHALLWELVANTVDLELAGRRVHVVVATHEDGSISVTDDGPGIASSIEQHLFVGHSTPTADGHAPHLHLLHRGLGLAVVGALSERVEVCTRRGDAVVRQRFDRGRASAPLERVVDASTIGTRIRCWPDRQVFCDYAWDLTAIARRLRELACLRPGLTCTFEPARARFDAELRLAALLHDLPGRAPLHATPVVGAARHDGVAAEVALRLYASRPGAAPALRGFCNLRELQRGVHVTGLRRGVGRAVAGVAPEVFGRAWRAAYDRVAPGLAAVIAIDTIDPRWRGPVRDDPTNPAIARAVAMAVMSALPRWLAARPTIVDRLTAAPGHDRG